MVRGKQIKTDNRDEIKSVISHCDMFHFNNDQILEELEDKNLKVGLSTLYKLRDEMDEDNKKRCTNIGKRELLRTHLVSIDEMNELLRRAWEDLKHTDLPLDKARISAEIRAIRKDLTYYYSSNDVVDSVYKYFTEEQEEKKKEDVKKVEKNV